jgi:hypothetical protein
MSIINHYLPHLQILPEDDANREIANGFLVHHSIKNTAAQVLRSARGWHRMLDTFEANHSRGLTRFPERRIVMLMDFDDDVEARQDLFKSRIDDAIASRVFLIGARNEPEDVKRALNVNFDELGRMLAQACCDESAAPWNHAMLAHNASELERLRQSVRPFLVSA